MIFQDTRKSLFSLIVRDLLWRGQNFVEYNSDDILKIDNGIAYIIGIGKDQITLTVKGSFESFLFPDFSKRKITYKEKG